jgi:uncharacterized protein YjiS (DUF1127 family)
MTMAYVTLPAHTDFGFAGRIDALRARFASWRARRALYERTLIELCVLSNAELADLGIHRCDIARVARMAADRG